MLKAIINYFFTKYNIFINDKYKIFILLATYKFLKLEFNLSYEFPYLNTFI